NRSVFHAARTYMQGSDQRYETDPGHQRKQKHDWRAVQSASQGQGVKQSTDGRPGDVGNLKDRGSPGDRVHEMFAGNQVWEQRRACRAAEGASQTNQEQHRENRFYSM